MTTRTCLPILWGLLLFVASQFPALAVYNPHTGRWLSRDPVEEEGGAQLSVFPSVQPQGLPVDDLAAIDINEYEFVSNNAAASMDYLGWGILCDCKALWWPGIPLASFDVNGKPQMDGGAICGRSAVGDRAWRTVEVQCSNTLRSDFCRYDCTKKDCLVAGEFVCKRRQHNKQRPYVWVSTGTAKVVRGCKKPKKTN